MDQRSEEDVMTARRRSEDHWHLDKTVNVGHMVTTAMAVMAVAAFLTSMDKRVDSNSQAIIYLKEEKVSIEQAMARQRNELIDNMKNIDAKLDRIIERQTDRKER